MQCISIMNSGHVCLFAPQQTASHTHYTITQLIIYLIVINRLFILLIIFALNVLESFKLVVFLFTPGFTCIDYLYVYFYMFIYLITLTVIRLIIGAVVHCVSTSDSEHERWRPDDTEDLAPRWFEPAGARAAFTCGGVSSKRTLCF